jgi:hypothetical protein
VGSSRQIDLISESTAQKNASTFLKIARLYILRRATVTSEMKCQAFLGGEREYDSIVGCNNTVLLLTFRRCVLCNLKMETEYHSEISVAIY